MALGSELFDILDQNPFFVVDPIFAIACLVALEDDEIACFMH